MKKNDKFMNKSKKKQKKYKQKTKWSLKKNRRKGGAASTSVENQADLDTLNAIVLGKLQNEILTSETVQMLTQTVPTVTLRSIVERQLFETNFPKQGLEEPFSNQVDMNLMTQELKGASKKFIMYSLNIPKELIDQKSELQRDFPKIYNESSVFYILSPGESPIKFTSFISLFPSLITKLKSKNIFLIRFPLSSSYEWMKNEKQLYDYLDLVFKENNINLGDPQSHFGILDSISSGRTICALNHYLKKRCGEEKEIKIKEGEKMYKYYKGNNCNAKYNSSFENGEIKPLIGLNTYHSIYPTYTRSDILESPEFFCHRCTKQFKNNHFTGIFPKLHNEPQDKAQHNAHGEAHGEAQDEAQDEAQHEALVKEKNLVRCNLYLLYNYLMLKSNPENYDLLSKDLPTL